MYQCRRFIVCRWLWHWSPVYVVIAVLVVFLALSYGVHGKILNPTLGQLSYFEHVTLIQQPPYHWMLLSQHRLYTAFETLNTTVRMYIYNNSQNVECCDQNIHLYVYSWTVQDRIPMRARFSALAQTGPGTHPACRTVGTVSFQGVKQPERGFNHPPPFGVEVKERVGLYLHSPICLHGVF
jgi:hypothetical protein